MSSEPVRGQRLRVVIAGGHGRIALLTARLLRAAGHQPEALIRNPAHAADVTDAGAEPVVFDLEQQTAAALAERVRGADALVFAAGAGPGSGAARKITVDRNGALLLADAAELAGVRRLVVVSALAADEYVVGSEDVFQVYLRAKAEADALIRERDLDWTIVRPGGLTDDEPTGLVRVAVQTGRGSIPRADVADVVVRLLHDGLALRRQFELVSGDVPAEVALRSLT